MITVDNKKLPGQLGYETKELYKENKKIKQRGCGLKNNSEIARHMSFAKTAFIFLTKLLEIYSHDAFYINLI